MYLHSCLSIRGCALFSLWNSPHHGWPKTVENKGSNVRYNKINITFPDWVIVENIIPRNVIINLGCAWVDNHIPRDDIFDYHPIRECNIYIILSMLNLLLSILPSIRNLFRLSVILNIFMIFFSNFAYNYLLFKKVMKYRKILNRYNMYLKNYISLVKI